MIPIEVSVFVAVSCAALGVLAGMLIHRAVAGRLWSAGEVRAWAEGCVAGRRDERCGWPAGGADSRRGDVVGELAWPMEGSDRPERH